MKTIKLQICIILILIVILGSGFALGIPSPAAEFYGNVSFNGLNGSNGTIIYAYDNDEVLCGSFTILNEGRYGLLSCNGDDPDTPEDEGALSGENLTFKIGNVSTRTYGNYSWISTLFFRVDLRQNYPPIIKYIKPQNLVTQVPHTTTVNATDPDGDLVYFFDDTLLFNINILTGVINYTPASDAAGNFSVNISVSDGLLGSSQIVYFNVEQGYCGDTFCGLDESCSTCSVDCGLCPGAEEGGGGAGDGAGDSRQRERAKRGAKAVEKAECKENWVCEEWSICYANLTQTRYCQDQNDCGTNKNVPEKERTCESIGTCSDGEKNCHDGECEEGIDCGGPCTACSVFTEEEAYAKLPIEEIPKPVCGDGYCNQGENCDCPQDCRNFAEFPWWIFLLIIMSSTVVMITFGVIVYILKYKNKVEQKKADQILKVVYRLYAASLVSTTVAGFYIYWCWWCWSKILIYLSATAIALTMLMGVIYVFYKYSTRYEEEKKEIKLKNLMVSHIDKLKELVKIEGRLIKKIENRIARRIGDWYANQNTLLAEFVGLAEVYKSIKSLELARKEKIGLREIEDLLVVLISNLEKREDYAERLSEHEDLKDLDEDLHLVLGYLARKHLLIKRITKIRKTMKEN